MDMSADTILLKANEKEKRKRKQKRTCFQKKETTIYGNESTQ